MALGGEGHAISGMTPLRVYSTFEEGTRHMHAGSGQALPGRFLHSDGVVGRTRRQILLARGAKNGVREGHM